MSSVDPFYFLVRFVDTIAILQHEYLLHRTKNGGQRREVTKCGEQRVYNIVRRIQIKLD